MQCYKPIKVLHTLKHYENTTMLNALQPNRALFVLLHAILFCQWHHCAINHSIFYSQQSINLYSCTRKYYFQLGI